MSAALALTEREEGSRALTVIAEERKRQLGEWARDHDQSHTPREWALLFAKHEGRLADLALEFHADAIARDEELLEAYRHRLAIIGALALAALEATY